MKRVYKIILAILLIAGAIGSVAYRLKSRSSTNTQYQTAAAQKGTLVVTVTASGQASSSNNTSISTQASGVVKQVFVQNGAVVTSGQKIAQLELDQDGKLRSTQALSNLQSAKNNLAAQQATMYSLNSAMWLNNQKFINDAVARSLPQEDPSWIQENSDWLAAEAKYKNQQDVVTQAQTALSAAGLAYQQSSPLIYAPIAGTVTGLSLQPGTVLLAQSSTTGTATSQKIASIKTNAPVQMTVNLSEVDVTNVTIGDAATITVDAFTGKTFTGKVISVDTIGTTASGVTTYPAVLALDTDVTEILPNMAVTANIITSTKDNVLLVPSTAVQSQNGGSTVKVMKNGRVQTVTVQTGESSDTQTEITSGLSEGDEVVINPTATASTNSSGTQTRSVFGGFGGGAVFRGR